MRPSEVTISGYVTIGNEQWLITVKAEVTASEYKALFGETAEMIHKLKESGVNPRLLEKQPANKGTTISGPEKPAGFQFAWPAPKCPTCDIDMLISKYQKVEGVIVYYCPNKKDSGEYCRIGTRVNESTGKEEQQVVAK